MRVLKVLLPFHSTLVIEWLSRSVGTPSRTLWPFKILLREDTTA